MKITPLFLVERDHPNDSQISSSSLAHVIVSIMAPKDAKIWNEDLVNALRAREDVSRREGKRDQITWKQGADLIESVRQDIYTVSTKRMIVFHRNRKPRVKWLRLTSNKASMD